MFQTVIALIMDIFYTLFTLISIFISVQEPVDLFKYEVQPEYSAVLMSDAHSDGNYCRDRNDVLREVFAGVRITDNGYDTLVISGDLTNSGEQVDYFFLNNALKVYLPWGIKLIPAVGNHDMRAYNGEEEPDPEIATEYFCEFAAKYGIKTDKTYYTYSDKYAEYIILGSEDTVEEHDNAAIISDEQLCWFETKLAEAVGTDKPVFVICHQEPPTDPANNDYIIPGTAGVKIRELLTEYSQKTASEIIFVYGHNHRDLKASSLKQVNDDLVYLNLPSVLYSGGVGVVCDIFEDKIVLTGVNFTQRSTVDFTYSIER